MNKIFLIIILVTISLNAKPKADTTVINTEVRLRLLEEKNKELVEEVESLQSRFNNSVKDNDKRIDAKLVRQQLKIDELPKLSNQYIDDKFKLLSVLDSKIERSYTTLNILVACLGIIGTFFTIAIPLFGFLINKNFNKKISTLIEETEAKAEQDLSNIKEDASSQVSLVSDNLKIEIDKIREELEKELTEFQNLNVTIEQTTNEIHEIRIEAQQNKEQINTIIGKLPDLFEEAKYFVEKKKLEVQEASAIFQEQIEKSQRFNIGLDHTNEVEVNDSKTLPGIEMEEVRSKVDSAKRLKDNGEYIESLKIWGEIKNVSGLTPDIRRNIQYEMAYLNLKKYQQNKTVDELEKVIKMYEKLNSDFGNSYFACAQLGNLYCDKIEISEIISSSEKIELYNTSLNYYKEASRYKSDEALNIYNWGLALAASAKLYPEEQTIKSYKKAIEKFEEVIQLAPDHFNAYCDLGLTLWRLAELLPANETSYFKRADKSFYDAVEIKPDDYRTYNNWAGMLGWYANGEKGEKAEKLFNRSFENYQKAISYKSDYDIAFSNWGRQLLSYEYFREDEDRKNILNEALEKFNIAVELNPQNVKAHIDLGTALTRLAKIQETKEAINTFDQAFSYYQKANDLSKTYVELYYNWGISIDHLIKITPKEDCEELYSKAIEKYKKALTFPSVDPAAYSFCALAIAQLAKYKDDKEKEILFNEAGEYYVKGIALGNRHYNYSCLLALKQEKEVAFKELQISLKNKEIKPDFVANDEDWAYYHDDPDFIELLHDYEDDKM